MNLRSIQVVIFASLFTLTGCASIDAGQSNLSGRKAIGVELWRSPNRNVSDELFLVSPSSANDEAAFGPQNVYLSNLNGEIKKVWRIPRTAGHSRLRQDGTLFSLLLSTSRTRLTDNGGECDELIATNKAGEQVLSIKRSGLSHDFEFVGENQIALFQFERLDSTAIRTFYPNSTKTFAYADRLVLMKKDGTESWSWSLKDNVRRLKLGRLNERNMTIATGNSIQYIEKNSIDGTPAFLMSFRNLNLVVLVGYPNGNVLWQSPPDSMSRQHDATAVGDRVLVFDNNIFSEVPTMRVLEFRIPSSEIFLKWTLPPWSPLTTSVMGGVRRLKNGSFLISNSISGHLMEIGSDGRQTWSYLIRPETAGQSIWPLGVSFYRTEIYSKEILERL